jgi:hypothetical protein
MPTAPSAPSRASAPSSAADGSSRGWLASGGVADDDDWAVQPPPMTAVAVRVEQEAVDAARPLADAAGRTVPELFRHWVLDRLEAELAPDAEPEPPPAPPTKRAPARKKAAKKKAAARKRA